MKLRVLWGVTVLLLASSLFFGLTSVVRASTNDLTLESARWACISVARPGAVDYFARNGYTEGAASSVFDPHYVESAPGNPIKWFQVGCGFKSFIHYTYDGPGGTFQWHQLRAAVIMYFYGRYDGVPLLVPGSDPWWWYVGETDHNCQDCWMDWGTVG